MKAPCLVALSAVAQRSRARGDGRGAARCALRVTTVVCTLNAFPTLVISEMTRICECDARPESPFRPAVAAIWQR